MNIGTGSATEPDVAGVRSTNRSSNYTRRSILCSAVSVAGICLNAAAAQAICTAPAATVTCTGNLSGGVSYTSTVTTLNVNSLTADILPASTVDGVRLSRSGSDGGDGGDGLVGGDGDDGVTGPQATINYTGGSKNISTSGTGAHGIHAISSGGDGGDGGVGVGIVVTPGLGGDGGDGKSGGAVTIIASGTIITNGTKAHGILGESIGGSGGTGGDGTGASVYSKGGDGGDAAGGGRVDINSSSTVTTRGFNSHGIFAQSTGGKGGAGGDGFGIVADWGPGGTTAPGGTVIVTNFGTINTNSTYSYGILAQSIGGFGGGSGGGGGLVAFGEDASSGGPGGAVTVNNSGTIATVSLGSHGIFAQSVGGGGGDAGASGGVVALGSSGAAGGAGSTVTVRNTDAGSITVRGSYANGIFAQSVGGGGGDGGAAVGLVGIGGDGASTSPGGQVTVENSQSITTFGDRSHAIFAQSVGGGGGNGGLSVGLVSIGGGGGSGGNGGNVFGTNSGTLLTGGAAGGAGNDSAAIFLQSVGGGGGNGGAAIALGLGASVAIGGSGSVGGAGGNVTFNQTANVNSLTAASIATTGDRSHGIQAQSVGGGGGNGGFAFSGTAPIGGISASFALGGRAGPGGASGQVVVNERGTITTSGDQAIGIFAQSVGGGGGNGGGSVATAAGGGYNLSLAIGGSAGSGGSAGTVTVNQAGSISTTGKLSHGILAQSVGGGGGNGGYSVAASLGGFAGSVALGGGAGVGGTGSTVNVNTYGSGLADPTISTAGEGANGIFAQSVGGGGGNGGLAGTLSVGSGSVGVSLGGKGAGGASGGVVNVTNRIAVATTGNNASGIFAQSVGGGGGNGGAALAGTGGVVGASVALGGGGGKGSKGNTVHVTNSGSIITGKPVDPDQEYGNLSYGIYAQSVGGGGGNGGFALAGAVGVSVKDIPAGAAAVSIGGKGGGASNGGLVTVDNTGTIQTYGLGAHAIFAQSVGGGGGSGGFAGSVALTFGDGGSFGVAVGGGASGGGNANTVTVNDTNGAASIITHANGADGVHAQSIGGGGGDGGFAFAGAAGFAAEGKSISVAVAIGGAGGAGGEGGAVNVTTHSAITTYGDNANGIMAQSVGGGGGNGGLAVSGTLTFAETAGAVGVSVGGAGGTGSIGKKVTVNNHGKITTWGADAMGILAQSIGGSGGNGGLSVTANMFSTTKTSATVGVSIGGGAGDSNYGGIVDVTNTATGSILTNGLGAHGIKAQSIGGGGGNGGLAVVAQLGKAAGTETQATKSLNVGVSVGGNGGTGGYGNTVDVTNDGSITVENAAASGIFAQSVGGGGGDGGGAVSGIGMLTDSTNKDSRAVTVTVTVGGSGGNANYGGAVTVSNTGSIVTKGGNGHGIFAESIGGGGGVGGRANTISMVVTDKCTLPALCTAPESAKNNLQLGVTIGGSGGTGGHGGQVVVNNTGTIETFADTSNGIYAQSVGAGGGDGGNGTIGSDGVLPVPGELAAIPTGSVSFYKNLQVVVGGSGGATGNGGIVEVNNNKNITTRGSNSSGIFAQSIGGGGGVGGTAAIGATGTFGLGGEGGAAGDGSKVTVNQYGGAKIETFGVAANAIFAQSVGGGGGVAGNVNRALANDIETPLSTIPGLNVGIGLAFGRSGGGGGNGGAVDIDADGTILTHGDSAAGVFAQSVGGGGGVLGELGNDLPVLSLPSWQIGSNGDVGDAGQVDVDMTGTIATAGNSAAGIFAQSAAGAAGGGHAGVAGNVNVTVNGSVLTGALLAAEDGTEEAPVRGLGSIGVFAQSAADNNSSNGNVVVTINGSDAVVRGGRSNMINSDDGYVGVGVWIMDGNANSVTNHGTIMTVDGVNAGYAILASGSDGSHPGGNETINNHNTVIGNVRLGAGANTFNNESGSRLWSGSTIHLGDDAQLFSNKGTFAPGSSGLVSSVWTTELTGRLVQGLGGVYQVDLDFVAGDAPTGLADRINVSGTAELEGKVDLLIVNPNQASPGYHEVTILSAAQNVTVPSLLLDAPASAVTMYDILYPTLQDVVLSYGIDFAPIGLNPNQTSFGEYINSLQLAGGSPTLAPLVGTIFGIGTLEELKLAYDMLSPEAYASNLVSTLVSASDFNNALMSCRERGGDYRFIAQGECGWMRVAARSVEYNATWQNFGFAEDTFQIAAGAQKAIGQDWHLGFGLSYENTQSAVEDLATIDGDRIQGGMVIKGRSGATTWAGSVIGGHGWFDTNRIVNIAALGGVSEATQELSFISGHMQIAHSFELGNTYFRPMFEAAITSLHQHGFTETGGGLGNLAVDARDELYVALTPSLEIGSELALGDGANLLRPRVKLGVTQYVGDANPTVLSTLVGTPDGVASFGASAGFDETLGNVELGFDLLTQGGVTIRMDGAAQFGENTEIYQGSLKVAVPF